MPGSLSLMSRAAAIVLLAFLGTVGDCSAQSSPSLDTEKSLRAENPGTEYVLTIRVDASGIDYSTAETWLKGVAKTQRKGGGNGVGHTWIQLSDGISVICGGHSGERGEANSGVRDGRVTGAFVTYRGGLLHLAGLDANAASPFPNLRNSKDMPAADPRNPIAWLFFIYRDGYWAVDSAGHDRATHEVSYKLSKDEYDAALSHIRKLTANGGERLREFGLTGNQCTATAAAIARKAGIDLDPYVEVEIPENVSVGGHTIRLRADAMYGKIRFAAPEKMACAISESVIGGKNGRPAIFRAK